MSQDLQKAKLAEARLHQARQSLDGALTVAGIMVQGRFRLNPSERKLWARNLEDGIDYIEQAVKLFREI